MRSSVAHRVGTPGRRKGRSPASSRARHVLVARTSPARRRTRGVSRVACDRLDSSRAGPIRLMRMRVQHPSIPALIVASKPGLQPARAGIGPELMLHTHRPSERAACKPEETLGDAGRTVAMRPGHDRREELLHGGSRHGLELVAHARDRLVQGQDAGEVDRRGRQHQVCVAGV